MDDFYYEVKEAIKKGSIEKILEDLSADPNIKLSTSSRPVTITDYAFYESESKYNSLEYIFRRSEELHMEIPFAGIFDEENLLVSKFIKGRIGECGQCDWQEGPLLKNAYKKASKLNCKVSLGHTHPPGFGAVCSCVYYSVNDLKGFKNGVSKKILETKLYKDYGGDYSIMLTMAQEIPLVSNYFWIMSPGEYQIGVFEIREKGKVIYHPWKVL